MLWINDCIWDTPPDAVWAKAGDAARSEVKISVGNMNAFFKTLTPPFGTKKTAL